MPERIHQQFELDLAEPLPEFREIPVEANQVHEYGDLAVYDQIKSYLLENYPEAVQEFINKSGVIKDPKEADRKFWADFKIYTLRNKSSDRSDLLHFGRSFHTFVQLKGIEGLEHIYYQDKGHQVNILAMPVRVQALKDFSENRFQTELERQKFEQNLKYFTNS